MKFDNMTQFGAPNLNERKSKITDGRHIEKKRSISPTVCQIFTKFGQMIQNEFLTR